MLVKFWKRLDSDPLSEWSLDHIPRVGEHVRLDKFVNGHVIAVDWHLGDEKGFIIKPPYVTVILS